MTTGTSGEARGQLIARRTSRRICLLRRQLTTTNAGASYEKFGRLKGRRGCALCCLSWQVLVPARPPGQTVSLKTCRHRVPRAGGVLAVGQARPVGRAGTGRWPVGRRAARKVRGGGRTSCERCARRTGGALYAPALTGWPGYLCSDLVASVPLALRACRPIHIFLSV